MEKPVKPRVKNQSTRLFIFYRTLIFLVSLMTMGCRPPKAHDVNHDNPNGRNDAWGFAGCGGGGAMFNPAVSPFNTNYAFVACDMTGSYVTHNGGLSWRMFSLRGPVHFFVFDPVDSNIVYANSIALFRSTDRGNTWNIMYPGPGEIKGIVAKGDHAEERIITNDSTSRHVLALAVDPDNSMKLHAAISVNNAGAYYTSDDQGRHWIKVKDLVNGAGNIYIVPSSPKENRTIFITGKNTVTVREKGIWTTNPGPVNVGMLTGFAGGFDRLRNKYILYAISGKSYFNPVGDPSGIYYTEDGGKTWENRQNGLLDLRIKNADLPEWRCISTSSSHPETVYVSYNGLKVHNDTTCIGVAKSEDFGRSWKLVWKDRLTQAGDLYSGNYKKGWIDERYDPTWGENPFSIAVSPANPDICYTTDFGRTIRTTDGGNTWEQVYSKKKDGAGWISRGLEVTTGYCMVFDPFDLNHLFMANTDIGLMESTDGGESWNSATRNNGIPHNWANSTYWLTFDPDVKGRAWAAMSDVHDLPRPKMWRRKGIAGYEGGILVTGDGGKTWQPVSRDMGEAAVTHILIDITSPKERRTLYACAFGKGVYKSEDGGKTWQQKNRGINNKEPFVWRIAQNGKNGSLYLIVSRRSDDGSIGNEQDGSLYRSDDGAESWKKIALPPGTNGPTSLLIDPGNTARLMLSAWGRTTGGQFTADTGGGIFLSTDNGKTWTQVLQKDQHIHDITFDPRNSICYACGFNGSAYRSEDRGKTWNRIQGFNFKWGKRVDPDPRDPDKIFIITFGGGVWYGPARGDDKAAEDIVTPVLRFHSATDLPLTP
jgi:photosystem II stability/assembly factor-like uncharacterized protein